MSDTECREMLWRAVQCGNPNKAWVCDYDGEKLSALMTLKAARALVDDHNRTVKFLMNHIERNGK